MEKTFRIEDGMIYGLTFDEEFTAIGPGKNIRRVNATWNFDGMPVDRFAKLAWENFKVRARGAKLSKMSDSAIASLKGQELMAVDYMSADTTETTAALRAKTAEQDAKLKAARQAFIKIANTEAVAELGTGAHPDAIKERTFAIYKEKYEALVE